MDKTKKQLLLIFGDWHNFLFTVLAVLALVMVVDGALTLMN